VTRTKKVKIPKSKMTKERKNGLIIVLCVLIFIGLSYFLESFKFRDINKNPAHVIGYVYDIHAGSESVIFRFFYKYNGKLYNDCIPGWFLRMQKRKILLKISKNKPDLWLHIDKDIPECIIEKSNLDMHWDTFPACDK
jgi:hypothetical protein